VRSRLQEVAAFAEIRVVAPIPAIDYSRPKSEWLRPKAVPPQRTDQRLEVYHPRWLYPPMGGSWNPWCLFQQLKGPVSRLRQEFPFDLIDSHFAFPDGIAASMLAARMGVPFTVTLRGNETLHAQSDAKRKLIQQALCQAARVICVAENLRRFAISLGADPDRVKTIPNGIDTALFYPRDRAECRRKHAIAPDARVILSVGSLIERKGHHRAVQALYDLGEQATGAQLLIAGGPGREGHFEQRIHQLVEQLGMQSRVRFLGQIAPASLPELMSAADLLCLASDREGWPNVVHEAMGCGCPVVATDVGGITDMMPSETYGFIVPPRQTDALSDAMGRALQKTWDHAAIAQWAGARSWKNVAAEVLAEFQAALPVSTAPESPASRHAGPR
jgi:glycosyltransferase involved in cell wall biosynthesis